MALSCERVTALARISIAAVAIAPPFSGAEWVLIVEPAKPIVAEVPHAAKPHRPTSAFEADRLVTRHLHDLIRRHQGLMGVMLRARSQEAAARRASPIRDRFAPESFGQILGRIEIGDAEE